MSRKHEQRKDGKQTRDAHKDETREDELPKHAKRRKDAAHDDVGGLKTLGAGSTVYPDRVSPELLETFPNRFPDGDYVIEFETAEFTSLCPKTGQPDFARITIRYAPDRACIESKSLKLYLGSFRNEGVFVETITNLILRALVEACRPRWMEVTAAFTPRGGIGLVCRAGYEDGRFTTRLLRTEKSAGDRPAQHG